MQNKHNRKRKSDTFFSTQEDTSINLTVKKFIKLCLYVFNDLEKITTKAACAEGFSSIERLGNSKNQTKKLLFINKLPVILQKLHIRDEAIKSLLEQSVPDIYFDVLENHRSDIRNGSAEFEEELTKFSQEILDTYLTSRAFVR